MSFNILTSFASEIKLSACASIWREFFIQLTSDSFQSRLDKHCPSGGQTKLRFFFVFFHDVCRLNSFIVSAFVDLSVKRDFSFAWWTPMWVSAYWLYVVNLIKSVGAQSKKWKKFDLPNRMKFIDQTCCDPTEAQKTFPHMKLPQLAAKSPLVSSFFTQKRRIAKAFSGKENFFVWRWKMEKHFT